MPYTVNGIGTTYFGSWNRQAHDNVCEFCQRRGKLVSYETWHCICVLFVPIIPLGKKQILNYCPSCTQHRVVSYREWTKLREKSIEETAVELSTSPDDPDKAIEMHATLVAFQKADEATQLAELIEQKFQDVARAQFYLAAWYEQTGKSAIANRLFLRSFELEPDTLPIRRAALLTFIDEGNVDQAKSLTQPFLPGSEQFDASVFYALAAGFQKLGRHQEAVQTLRMLLDAAPGLKSDKTFRKTLLKSEKALGVEQLTVPADPFYRTSAFWWISGTAAVVAGLLLWNGYIASNRSVTVVNGLKSPITVSMDGSKSVQVPGGGQSSVVLGEGRHEAEVTTPAATYPKMAFEVSSDWWERFFRQPVYIIDPTKSAAVIWEEATYVRQGIEAPDSRYELKLGETFSSHAHVDYRFLPFPDEIKLGKSRSIVKTRVDVLHEDVADLVQRARFFGLSPASTLPFLQTHLQESPDRDDLLPIYTYFSLQAGKEADCRDFLRQHLADRPVRVAWHRMYQSMATQGLSPDTAREQLEKLKSDYSEMVEREPNDASLLYLRGRLEGHTRKAEPYFEKSLSLEPNQPYTLFASGHDRLVNGKFEEALAFFKKADEAKPNDSQFRYMFEMAQLAANDLEGLEKSARDELAQSPLNPKAIENLLKVHIARNQNEIADQELASYLAKFQQIAAGRFTNLMQPISLNLAAMKGDFRTVETLAASADEAIGQQFLFFAKLQSDELLPVPEGGVPAEIAYWHLCRSLVATRLGDAAQAAASRDVGLQQLERGFDSEMAAADCLKNVATLTYDDVADLGCEPRHKAVVLVAIARERADLAPQLLDLAEKLNFDLEFPHYLLEREIAERRKQSQ